MEGAHQSLPERPGGRTHVFPNTTGLCEYSTSSLVLTASFKRTVKVLIVTWQGPEREGPTLRPTQTMEVFTGARGYSFAEVCPGRIDTGGGP
jgi:hypothetical protein